MNLKLLNKSLEIYMIVATDICNGFAKNNTIPWKINNDLKYFKDITTKSELNKTNVVIMGRVTFETLNYKPLINRINIIISNTLNSSENSLYYVSNSLLNSLILIESFSDKVDKIFIIGGENIYKSALEILDIKKIYKTVVHNNFNCDRFFPDLTTYNYILESSIYNKNTQDLDFTYELWIK